MNLLILISRQKTEEWFCFFKNSNFLIHISMNSDVVNLWYFKLILFDLTEFISFGCKNSVPLNVLKEFWVVNKCFTFLGNFINHSFFYKFYCLTRRKAKLYNIEQILLQNNCLDIIKCPWQVWRKIYLISSLPPRNWREVVKNATRLE